MFIHKSVAYILFFQIVNGVNLFFQSFLVFFWVVFLLKETGIW